MTASENSLLGFAMQEEFGEAVTDDDRFIYMPFLEGSMGVNNLYVPLGQEIGGGAIERSIEKMGYISMGQFSFIPRANSLGYILTGIMGQDVIAEVEEGVPQPGPEYTHTITFTDDPFFTPWFTFRISHGGIAGEVIPDCRIESIQISIKPND